MRKLVILTITVNRTPDSAGNLAEPVQLTATPVAGFSGMTVTFTPQINVPGTITSIKYDFTGDNTSFTTAPDQNPITHHYNSPGQFFPTITVQTTAGTFSSPGGWNSSDPNRLGINVQTAPQVVGTPISVTDPIDLKCTVDNKLYILSRSGSAIYEYDVSGSSPALLRSLTGVGTTPTGLDVDSAGNVYVALNADNQVAKFTPSGADSFVLDTTFGNLGFIGGAGTEEGKFSGPYDVAVSPSGGEIAVTDSGNNRLQRFTSGGNFSSSFGAYGSGIGQFNNPKGLTYDVSGYLYIVDSGNGRIVLADGGNSIVLAAGSVGTAAGQFQAAVNLAVGSHATYIADSGNNRVQSFSAPTGHNPFSTDPSKFRFAISAGLSQPAAVAPANDLVAELLYVADTGNNRVLLYNLPLDNPVLVWSSMINGVASGDSSGALSHFSVASIDEYRNAFTTAGLESIASALNHIGAITPVSINDDTAVYTFTDTIDGQIITFPVKFTKENGAWKISEF